MKTNFIELYASDEYRAGHNPEKKKFNAEVRNIVTFISSYFSHLDQKGFRGIRIDLNGQGEITSIQAPTKDYPICRVVFPYNYQSLFFQKSNEDKKAEIVSLVRRGVTLGCEATNFDFSLFKDGFNKLESLDLQFFYSWNKPQTAKGRKTKIHITCELEPGFLHYFLNIDSQGVIEQKKLITLNTYYDLFRLYNAKSTILTEAKWIDENTYCVFGKKGSYERIRYAYNLKSAQLTITFDLEADVNKKEFLEEFELATTENPDLIEKILNNKDVNKWNIYV